jgi:hypothetical protein
VTEEIEEVAEQAFMKDLSKGLRKTVSSQEGDL